LSRENSGPCSFRSGPDRLRQPLGPAPTIVKVPVPVPCVSAQLPGPPDYPDTAAALRAAPDLAEFTRLLSAGWPLRDARLTALEAAVEACRAPPRP